ncbi:MAG: T9SS type A sorting domain-containing protein [Parafilimonas sp.]|nr:T9SS type A sorting domain-containing protein [Parafilimonas sp.]
MVNFTVDAQVNNTGALYIAGNAGMYTDFTNAASSSYQNDGNLYITGDFINNQPSMAEGTGTTQFTGTSLQKIRGVQSSVFHHVYLNNVNGVQMQRNTTMGGTISTVAGSLYFNGYALTMGGKINTAYTNTSAFNVTSSSDLNITGPAGTGNPLYFAPSGNTLHNLTITSGATGMLGNALNITAGSAFGTVTSDGTFNANNFLTIKSDANGTARIAQSSGTITNFVTVERYIPPRRAWRFMSVPVVNDTLHIRTAWQEGVNNPSLSVRYDPHPGYGTHITGDNNTSNGFDYNTTYNASLKVWVQATNSWSSYAPSTLYTLINDYNGYCLFVRGSRAVDLSQATNAIPDATILRVTGNINNGSWAKPYAGVKLNDLLLVGNPYASSIDIASMLNASSGIYSNKFWVWDPALSGSYGVGGYVVYNNGIMAPLTQNYPAPTTIIQAEQAFLVQSNNVGATINLKQADKTSSETGIFARNSAPAHPAVYVNLVVPSNNSFVVEDGVATGFGNRFSANVDTDDAMKLWNFYENIALIRNGTPLSIEMRPMPVITDTLFYKMYLRQQPYALQVFAQDAEKIKTKAWLVDKYLHTETALDLYDTTIYNFTPNPDTNSYRNRFMIVFRIKLNGDPVPVSKSVDQLNPDETGSANSIASSTGYITVYPNPVTGKSFILNLNDLPAGNYNLNFYSLKGALLFTKQVDHKKTNSNYTINLPSNISAGAFTLQLVNKTGTITKSISLIIARQ